MGKVVIRGNAKSRLYDEMGLQCHTVWLILDERDFFSILLDPSRIQSDWRICNAVNRLVRSGFINPLVKIQYKTTGVDTTQHFISRLSFFALDIDHVNTKKASLEK